MNNKKASMISTVADWAMFLGVVGGLIAGAVFRTVTVQESYYIWTEKSYNWGLAIGCIVGSAVTFLLLKGFAEVMELLDGIRKNTDVKSRLLTLTDQTENIAKKLDELLQKEGAPNGTADRGE